MKELSNKRDNSPRAVVARYWDLYNAPGGIQRTPELCSEDCVHQPSAGIQYVGRKAQSERIATVASLVRDWTVVPHETLVDGEDAATRYTWRGTAAVAFVEFEPGTRLRLDATCFFTVRDGLIVRLTDVPGRMVRDEEPGP